MNGTNDGVYQVSFVPSKGTLSPVGIDKIHIHTQDFRVSSATQLAIVPHRKPQGKIWDEVSQQPLFVCDGVPVIAEKAYHNSSGNDGNEEAAVISATINSTGLTATYNPSKLIGKKMGELASVADVRAVTNQVQTYLENNGIYVPLSEGNLSRVDLAKDREMSQPVFNYTDVWRVLRGKRMPEKVMYPHGYRVGSKRRQFIFYDKGLEINPKLDSSNTMRGEVRFIRNATIDKQVGIKTLNDMYNLDEKYLGQFYNSWLTREIFRQRNDDSQLTFDFTGEVALLKSLYDKTYQGRGSFKYWLALDGVEVKLQKLGGMDNVRRILSEVYSRDKVEGMLSEMEDMLRLKVFLDRTPTTLSSKYEEVRLKFVA